VISRERLEALRNVSLCDVHDEAWQEIVDTIDALLKVKEAAAQCRPPCDADCEGAHLESCAACALAIALAATKLKP
jgi:hypothetical protein